MASFKKRTFEADSTTEYSSAKRGRDGDGEGGGGKGGGGPPPLTTVIPRHIGLWNHTIELNCVSWEEIGNTVKWLPLHMFPQQFMYANSKQNLQLFERWMRSALGYQLHSPTAKMSNFQFLQDAISMAAGTPETTTAPTQAAYLLAFSPKNQSSEQFQIIDVKANKALGWTVKGDQGLGSVDGAANQLVDLAEGDTDFEQLAYRNVITDAEGINKTLYEMGLKAGPSGVYQTPTATENIGIHTIQGKKTGDLKIGQYFRNYCKNSSYIKMLKHGDEYEWNIHNNCDGYILKNLGNKGVNLTSATSTVTSLNTIDPSSNHPAMDVLHSDGATTYDRQAFIWPTKENPPYSRKQKEASIGLLDHFCENAKTLNNKFFILAPMKGPPPSVGGEGPLLKQRCSVLLEQKMKVTFWFRDDVPDITDANPETQLLTPYLPANQSLPWNILRDQDFTLRHCQLTPPATATPDIVMNSFVQ